MDESDAWTASEGTAANELLRENMAALTEEIEKRYPKGYPHEMR
jgi:hypothetical protein